MPCKRVISFRREFECFFFFHSLFETHVHVWACFLLQMQLAKEQKLANDALQDITQAMQQAAERKKEVEVLEGATKEEETKTLVVG